MKSDDFSLCLACKSVLRWRKTKQRWASVQASTVPFFITSPFLVFIHPSIQRGGGPYHLTSGHVHPRGWAERQVQAGPPLTTGAKPWGFTWLHRVRREKCPVSQISNRPHLVFQHTTTRRETLVMCMFVGYFTMPVPNFLGQQTAQAPNQWSILCFSKPWAQNYSSVGALIDVCSTTSSLSYQAFIWCVLRFGWSVGCGSRKL